MAAPESGVAGQNPAVFLSSLPAAPSCAGEKKGDKYSPLLGYSLKTHTVGVLPAGSWGSALFRHFAGVGSTSAMTSPGPRTTCPALQVELFWGSFSKVSLLPSLTLFCFLAQF